MKKIKAVLILIVWACTLGLTLFKTLPQGASFLYSLGILSALFFALLAREENEETI